ncbi:MAG: helix-turn-helix transcriptional regulator [Streptomycetaceae bacterium]|nr:helix-turn-helix transcriptional regulator [Streptomycetaceae bacterium]
MLNALGLDAVDEQVYWGLLTHPDLGVVELAETLALSEKQVRAAMDKLGALTLLSASRDSPGEMRPVSPQLGLYRLLEKQEAELERQRREIELSRAAVRKLVTDYSGLLQREARFDVEQLVGLDEVQTRLEEFVRSAERETRSAIPGGPPSAATLEASRPLDAALLQRGISQRVLYQDIVKSNAVTVEYCRWMMAEGAEVRTAPVLPSRLLIVDSAVALVPVDPDQPGLGAMFIRTPAIVSSLCALFDQTWQLATALDDAPARSDATTISEGDRTLLTLLAAGYTDEAVAKRLGVSLRTVRRRVHDLMIRLGASSRLDAGLKAGQRGWIN